MAIEQYQPSKEQEIEGKFWPEALEEATQVTRGIFEEMKVRMLEIGREEGSSSEQKKKLDEFLQMWREFGANLFAATSSDNHRSPEKLDTAIRGANALLAPEASTEDEGYAREMISKLERRYGGSK